MAGLRGRNTSWDRFSHAAPGAAMLVALLVIGLLLAASLTAPPAATGPGAANVSVWLIAPGPPDPPAQTDDRRASAEARPAALPASPAEALAADLALREGVIARVAAGQRYHAAAIAEMRERGLPQPPGLMSIPLPTLTLVAAALARIGAGGWGMIVLAAILGGLTLAAWWQRLEDEPGGRQHRLVLMVLIAAGVGIGLRAPHLALPEAWAGVLIALGLALDRRGRLGGALLAAALALAISELAVVFAVLMGALALARGGRRAAAAWGVLIMIFILALMVHLVQVALVAGPQDLAGGPWPAWRGVGGWTGNIVNSSPLHLLPGWLAAPLALLSVLGWAGWRCDAGRAVFMLCLCYGLLFMIAGTDVHFHWGLVVMPLWFAGLAFVPRALASLWRALRG